jgi:hypothetical protein
MELGMFVSRNEQYSIVYPKGRYNGDCIEDVMS